MPTAARLTAAVCLALMGYALSRMIMPLMPTSTQFGYFIPTNIALGLVVGWRVIGSRAGGGVSEGITNGVTGAVVLVFWGLFVQSGREMIEKAMMHRFDGVGDALVGMIGIGAEYFLIMATVPIIAVVLLGGAVSGIVTNLINRRFP
ncbi:MAG: TrgA family protein [Rhodobacterales bacterium]